jgi:hypothetical protein
MFLPTSATRWREIDGNTDIPEQKRENNKSYTSFHFSIAAAVALATFQSCSPPTTGGPARRYGRCGCRFADGDDENHNDDYTKGRRTKKNVNTFC